MEVDISGALRSLQQVVDRIAELIEWEKLVQQEQDPHRPPAFRLPDHFHEDIEAMYASFWNLGYDIHEALKRPDVQASHEERRRWKRRLEELEEQFSQLGFAARFIKG